MLTLLRREAQIPVLWITGAIFFAFGHAWIAASASNTLATFALFAWLFGTIMWGAFGVVRHAEELAEKLGEPYGTLILTMSVTIIEVMFIITAMAKAESFSPLARDSVFAVLMIMLNGVVGLCLLLGALRHHEQDYNLPGARAFLAVAIPLTVFALVLPNFTTGSPGPTLSKSQAIVIMILTLTLYGIFLAIQTVRHRGFFQDLNNSDHHEPASAETPALNAQHHSSTFHAVALGLVLIPVVYLTEVLGQILNRVVAAAGAPEAAAGVVVAILVLAPEAMGALNAALRNRLQRAVNIALGSALATIGLTIPAVLMLGLIFGRPIVLGLEREEMVLLVTTLVVATLTFGGVRTNMLQGVVHLVMFLVFILLLFDP